MSKPVITGIPIYWGGVRPEKPLPEEFQYSDLTYNTSTKAYNREGKRFMLRAKPDALIPETEPLAECWDFDNPILL